VALRRIVISTAAPELRRHRGVLLAKTIDNSTSHALGDIV